MSGQGKRKKQEPGEAAAPKHLREQLPPSNNARVVASINSLPSELLQMVFAHFMTRPLLMVISFVCKRWRLASLRCIEALPRGAMRQAPECVQQLFPSLTQLRLDRVIRTIPLPFPGVLRSLVLDIRVSESPFGPLCVEEYLARNASTLSALVKLSVAERWNCSHLPDLLSCCQANLTFLTLLFRGRDEPDTLTDVYDAWFTKSYLPHLEHLRIGATIYSVSPHSLARFVGRHQTQLKTLVLQLDFCKEFVAELKALQPPLHLPKLIRFAPSASEASPVPFTEVADCTPVLRDLEFRGITANAWIEICQHAPHLVPLVSVLTLETIPEANSAFSLDNMPRLETFYLPEQEAFDTWPYPSYYTRLSDLSVDRVSQFLLGISLGARFPHLRNLSMDHYGEAFPQLPPTAYFPQLRTLTWTGVSMALQVLEWLLSASPLLEFFSVPIASVQTQDELHRLRSVLQRAERNGVLVATIMCDSSSEIAEHQRHVRKFMAAVLQGKAARLELETGGAFKKVQALKHEFKWMKLFVKLARPVFDSDDEEEVEEQEEEEDQVVEEQEEELGDGEEDDGPLPRKPREQDEPEDSTDPVEYLRRARRGSIEYLEANDE